MPVEQTQWTQAAEFEQQVTLSGVTYRLDFKFNDEAQRYVMDIYSADRVLLVAGTPLVRGALLLQQIVDERLPDGDLIVFGDEPTFENMGVSANLYYVTDD